MKSNNKNFFSPIKLIKYYKLINHNLIYNNKAINRYKKDNFAISADKTDNLKKLKNQLMRSKIVVLKIMLLTWYLVMVIQSLK